MSDADTRAGGGGGAGEGAGAAGDSRASLGALDCPRLQPFRSRLAGRELVTWVVATSTAWLVALDVAEEVVAVQVKAGAAGFRPLDTSSPGCM